MFDLREAVERGFITEEQRVAFEDLSAQFIVGALSLDEYNSALVALGVGVADEEADRE